MFPVVEDEVIWPNPHETPDECDNSFIHFIYIQVIQIQV
jgi:hypothetical protein